MVSHSVASIRPRLLANAYLEAKSKPVAQAHSLQGGQTVFPLAVKNLVPHFSQVASECVDGGVGLDRQAGHNVEVPLAETNLTPHTTQVTCLLEGAYGTVSVISSP